MKTQIIQLETYDDVVSVRDKMGWGQTSRILLVWPGQGHPLDRRLDLVLLQRHSLAVGAQLALVTQDKEIRANATELNIPTFTSMRQAQTGRWRAGRRRRARLWRKGPRADLRLVRPEHLPGRLEHPWIQRGLFVLSLLAIVALAAVLLPGASVEVETPISMQQITVPITADENATVVNLAGLVPAGWESIVVEGRDTVPSTGTVQVPEKPATGKVKFTNLTQNKMNVPAGTVVSTLEEPVIRFATIKDGSVPAGVGKTTTIDVQALVPGTQGNLGAGKLQAIEGPIGLQLSATNESPVRGGTSLAAAGPAPKDREKAYASLLKSLEQSATSELLTRWELTPLNASFPITTTLKLVNTLEMVYTPDEGEPADKLELTLRLEFKILTVKGNNLERLVNPLLDAALETNQRAVAGTLSLKKTSPVKTSTDGRPQWSISASRQVEQVLTQAQVADAASRLSSGKAAQILMDRLDLKVLPQLKTWPEWWPFLPIWPARIEVRFK
jgi:hypothetical protein